MKGMSTALIITITAVVILIVALIVLTIFSGGIGNISSTICKWMGSCEGEANTCISSCNAWRLANCNVANPAGVEGVSCTAFPGCKNAGSVCDCGGNMCG